MGDISIPQDLKTGDCVTCSMFKHYGVGIVIDVFNLEDPHTGVNFVAEVFWSTGRCDPINIECLFPAFN